MLTGLLGLLAAGCNGSSGGGGGFVPTTTTKKKKSNPPPPPPPPPPGVPSLSLTTPTEGDFVPLDVPLTVSWTSANLGGTTVLSFSSDGGLSYTQIASGLPASGSTTWTPTGLTSARLRIESTGGAVVDEHTADFEFRRVWFVDPTATAGAGDGTTWADAVGRIQTALDELASPGDLVWVSNQTTLTAFDVSDAAVVIVREQTGLYGGFAGTETALSQRPATLTRTTIDGQGTQGGFRIISSTAAVTTVDGFRVTGGASPGSGGGLFASGSSVAVVDCLVELSSATSWGGGAAFIDCPAVTVTDCTFDQNVAGDGGGGLFTIGSGTLDVDSSTFTKNTLTGGISDGGGLCSKRSLLTVTDTTFSENVALRDGGGIYTNLGSPTITGCEFLKNASGRNGGGVAQVFGTPTIVTSSFVENDSDGLGFPPGIASQLPFGAGGLYVENVNNGRVERSSFFANTTTNGAGVLNVKSSMTLENCVLADNTAAGLGGGVFTASSGLTHLSFCTLTRNSASKGAAFGMMHNPNTSTIASSILFGDVADEVGVFEDRPLNLTISDSDVGQVDITGAGVIDADPLFVNPATRDFKLDAGSPAIGAGNPTGAPAEDLDGLPRDAAPDMGAFERQ